MIFSKNSAISSIGNYSFCEELYKKFPALMKARGDLKNELNYFALRLINKAAKMKLDTTNENPELQPPLPELK